MLELERPLSYVDLETTGPHTTVDRVVQIAVIKVYPNGTRNCWDSLVNPRMPIPPEATECHGITDEDVRDAPTFYQLGPQLAAGFKDCDYAGYNLKFDIRVLLAEFKRNNIQLVEGLLDGRVIDGYRIFQRREPRNLAAAVERFLKEKMEGAHRAPVDIEYTRRVIDAQLEEYADLPRKVGDLAWLLQDQDETSNLIDPEGKFAWRYRKATVNFGKNVTRPLEQVARADPGYLRWMLAGDFSEEAKYICREALEGRFPTHPSEKN